MLQFIQETRSHQKSTDAANRNLETQLGQLAHERAERPIRTFGANTEKNPREECRAVMTRAQKNAQEERTMTEDEGTEDKKEETKEEEKLEEEEKVVSPPKTKSQKAIFGYLKDRLWIHTNHWSSKFLSKASK